MERLLGLDVGRPVVAAGDLVILPEMFDTGFSLDAHRTADSDGRTLAFLRTLAQRCSCVVHGSRTLLTASGRGLNMATIVRPDGEVVGEYAKIHPFLGLEAERFEPGSSTLSYDWPAVTSVDGGDREPVRVGVAICYDLRFPELFRRLVKPAHGRPVELIAMGANWPVARAHHWRALLIARAIENQAYVAGVNRVGRDPSLAYQGGSIVVGPKGECLGELDDREGVLSVEIDASEVRRWRASFPALKDARLLPEDN